MTVTASLLQWNRAAEHFFGWHLSFAGGFFCMCSWGAEEAGFQARWTSDLICSGTWGWLWLLRHGWPGSPAGGRGWAPRALPRAGPVGITLCQTWARETWAQLGSQEHGMLGQLGGFTQSPCPSLEDTTCVKFTWGRKWRNKSDLIKNLKN